MKRFKFISRNDKAHVEVVQGAVPNRELAVLRQLPLDRSAKATSAFVNIAMKPKQLGDSEGPSHLGGNGSCSLGLAARLRWPRLLWVPMGGARHQSNVQPCNLVILLPIVQMTVSLRTWMAGGMRPASLSRPTGPRWYAVGAIFAINSGSSSCRIGTLRPKTSASAVLPRSY